MTVGTTPAARDSVCVRPAVRQRFRKSVGSCVLLLLGLVAGDALADQGAVTIRTDFPGGNVAVAKNAGGTVHVAPDLRGDRDKFKQVLINLLKNSVEAADPGGRIQIVTHDQVNAGGRSFVEIMVTDDGPGVPQEQLEHLFRPQPSVKGSRHAGLGLTIASNLMRELGGQIVYRPQRTGACFQLLLPRIEQSNE